MILEKEIYLQKYLMSCCSFFRHDRPDQMGSPLFATPPQMQRSFSSPDSLQKQALVSVFVYLYIHVED